MLSVGFISSTIERGYERSEVMLVLSSNLLSGSVYCKEARLSKHTGWSDWTSSAAKNGPMM